jgi:hypothetical protein
MNRDTIQRERTAIVASARVSRRQFLRNPHELVEGSVLYRMRCIHSRTRPNRRLPNAVASEVG